MAELNPAGWLQNSGATNTARLLRLGAGSLGAGLSLGITPRGGVHPSLGGALAVTPGVGLSVDVASGVAHVAGNQTDTVAHGVYVCCNSGTVNIPLEAADGSDDRIDLIVARVLDDFYDTGGLDEWRLESVTGTPAAVPVAPTPAFDNYLILAEVLVPALATSVDPGNITDRRPFLAAAGGAMPIRDGTEYPSTGLYDGFLVFRQDTNDLEVRHSSAWNGVGGGALNHIETQTGTTISFQNIPQTYRHLRLIGGVPVTGCGTVLLRYNNLTGASDYFWAIMELLQTDITPDSQFGDDSIPVSPIGGAGAFDILIANYTRSNRFGETIGTVCGDVPEGLNVFSGGLVSAARVSRIDLVGDISVGSRVSLYGVS